MGNDLPFLEVHHVKHLAQKGSDRTSNAVALCPNCYQRCHRSSEREALTDALYSKVHGSERLLSQLMHHHND